MSFEQISLEIGVGVGMGTLIAIMSFLSTKDPWNNRLFAYTLVIGVFTTFAVIEGIEGGIGIDPTTGDNNIVKVLLLVAGASFFANKGIKMAERIRAKTTPPGTGRPE